MHNDALAFVGDRSLHNDAEMTYVKGERGTIIHASIQIDLDTLQGFRLPRNAKAEAGRARRGRRRPKSPKNIVVATSTAEEEVLSARSATSFRAYNNPEKSPFIAQGPYDRIGPPYEPPTVSTSSCAGRRPARVCRLNF